MSYKYFNLLSIRILSWYVHIIIWSLLLPACKEYESITWATSIFNMLTYFQYVYLYTPIATWLAGGILQQLKKKRFLRTCTYKQYNYPNTHTLREYKTRKKHVTSLVYHIRIAPQKDYDWTKIATAALTINILCRVAHPKWGQAIPLNPDR